MWELGPALRPSLRAGEPVAVVTVWRVERSAPRPVGSSTALTRTGAQLGSLSSGCVDTDAALLAAEVLATGRPLTASLGLGDEDARAAGLACGGRVDVVVHRLDPADAAARPLLEELVSPGPGPGRLGVVLSGPDVGRLLGGDRLPRAAWTASTSLVVDGHDGAPVLVLVRPPRHRLVLVGAGEHAAALCRLASAAGHDVVVCDEWDRLLTRERFPAAVGLVTGPPAEVLAGAVGPMPGATAVCATGHDERVDVPALAEALRLGVGFVGAMGSRRSAAHRAEALARLGVAAADVRRVRMPLGLDLGGSTPEETALAVLAEVVAVRRGGTGLPLRDLDGPVHRRPAPGESPPGGDAWTSTPSRASAGPPAARTWPSPRARSSSPAARGS